MNNQSSGDDPNTRSLAASAALLVFTWLGQTARLYVAWQLDISRFPSTRIFPVALTVPILVGFFFSSLQQGVDLGLDAMFTGALLLMAISTIRLQPNVRASSAFISVLFLGSLIGWVLQCSDISPTIGDVSVSAVFSVWMMLVTFRVALATLPAKK